MQRLTPPRPLRFSWGRLLALTALSVPLLSACASGRRWVSDTDDLAANDREHRQLVDDRDRDQKEVSDAERATIGGQGEELSEGDYADSDGERPVLRLKGQKKLNSQAPVDGKLVGVFRNTYYDFPSEPDFSGTPTPLMSRSCKPIKEVPRGFYDAVCVQGSGTLATGTTVSFAKRDCSCATICERTGQKICFDELDRKQFPWGRGAMGKAITPLRSVAVDSDVIPLGTPIYIPEFDGIPRKPGAAPHDGCFVAEDRGMKVVGEHVDVFTGNAHVTAHFNQRVPSNAGVHVYIGTARCQ